MDATPPEARPTSDRPRSPTALETMDYVAELLFEVAKLVDRRGFGRLHDAIMSAHAAAEAHRSEMIQSPAEGSFRHGPRG